MNKKTNTLLVCLLLAVTCIAQHPLKHFMDAMDTRYNSKQPVIHYLLTIDSTDLTSFKTEIRLHNLPATFQLAMVTHPEYDDRFWRFVKDLRRN